MQHVVTLMQEAEKNFTENLPTSRMSQKKLSTTSEIKEQFSRKIYSSDIPKLFYRYIHS